MQSGGIKGHVIDIGVLILEEFKKTGGRVKIASTILQLVDPPPLAVKLSGKPD